MNLKEKIILLNNLEKEEQLSDEQFEILKNLSEDPDEDIRFRVTYIIAGICNEEAKNMLLKLTEDKDNLVRLEAYDCLRVYISEDVEKTLKKAIHREKIYKLACYYAIKSWAEVTSELYDTLSGKLKYIQSLRKSKRFRNSDRCQLAFCYAEYVLGNEFALEELLKYLRHKDVNIRSCAVMLLMQILDENNCKKIEKEVNALFIREKSKSVKYSIGDFNEKKSGYIT